MFDLQNDVMTIACFLVPKGVDIQVNMTNSTRRTVAIESQSIGLDVNILAVKMEITKEWPEPVISITKRPCYLNLSDAAIVAEVMSAALKIAQFMFSHQRWHV